MNQQQYGLSADNFQELQELDWILHRPDSYVGSMDRNPRPMFCYNINHPDLKERRIKLKTVTMPEALDSINCEIAGNAADNVLRSRNELGLDPIRIEMTMTDQTYCVKNYGACITVEKKQFLEGIQWIPTQVFTSLRTSSNYDDSKVRMYVGKNGLGAKLTAIFSKEVYFECADPGHGVVLKQHVSNNRRTIHPPEFVQLSTGQPGYTLYQFQPDFQRFGCIGYDQECLEVTAAHAVEIAYARKIPVVFNGTTIKIDKLSELVKYFFPTSRSNSIEYVDPNGVYEICIVDTPNEAVSLSLVNGMITRDGGVHVDEAFHVIVDRVKEILGKSLDSSGVQITKRDFVNHVSMFLSVNVDKPKYKSQTKSYLSGPTPKISIPDELLKTIRKWKLVEQIYLSIEQRMKNKIKKSEAENRRDSKVKGGGVFERNFTSGVDVAQTIGIMVEGESAGAYGEVFVGLVPGRRGKDYFGQLPLHGKIPNAINNDFIQIAENKDIKQIKKFYGIEEDMDYMIPQNRKRLKYGKALAITDPDTDGKHILGLILLLFMTKYMTLVVSGFLNFMRVPILRIKKGSHKWSFYTYQSYLKWRDHMIASGANPDDKSFDYNYFKGLGTSEKDDIREDFEAQRIVTFTLDQDGIQNTLMAFHKTKREERKLWIGNWIHNYIETIDVEPYVYFPITTFIIHELVEFADEAVQRAIPRLFDGFKESQAKAFFAARKRLVGAKKDKAKTVQVANYAADITCYKHGEHCLADAITNLVYNFPGTNNMPVITGRGMTGTRVAGGKDAAADRYTFVSMPNWIDLVFRKEDDCLLKHIVDEGEDREFKVYYPIIPMVLVNGATGVGVGWSSEIPTHNPLDLAFCLQQRLLQILQPEGNHVLPLVKPWYKDWTGDVILGKDSKFITRGRFEFNQDCDIVVTELPIGTWFNKYREMLDKWEEEGLMTEWIDRSDEVTPMFILKGFKEKPNHKNLGLINNHSYQNMTVLVEGARGNWVPMTFNRLEDIFEAFFTERLKVYYKRKEVQLGNIKKDITQLQLRLTLINTVRAGKLVFQNRARADVKKSVLELGFTYELFKSVGSDEYNDDSVRELEEEIKKKHEKYDELNMIAPEYIWHSELENFIVKWCKREKVSRSTFGSCNKPIELTF
jgi:DNA topoisomerase-2